MSSSLAATTKDIFDGIANWRFWLIFGSSDLIDSYSRTRLGLLFVPLLAAIWVFSVVFILGSIVARDRPEYGAYVAIGFVLYTFVSRALTTSFGVFRKGAAIIKNMPIGMFNFVMRDFWRTTFELTLQFTVVAATFFVIAFETSPLYLEAAAGLAIFLIAGLLITLLSGIVGTFLPDLSTFVNGTTRLLFFVTPVWWYVEDLGPDRAFVAQLNPVSHLIDIVRMPLLYGQSASVLTWWVCLGTIGVLGVIGLFLFGLTRRHIILHL